MPDNPAELRADELRECPKYKRHVKEDESWQASL